MNKLKHLLPVLMAAVMAFTIPFAVACKKDNDNSGTNTNQGGGSTEGETVVTQTLESITVNAANAKTEYYAGEPFNYEGLVVTASVQDSDKSTPETKTLTARDYVVDLSEFNQYQGGTYNITVSYTLNNVTKTGSYSVTVIGGLVDGLVVSLAEGATDTYTLTAENPNAEIDLTQIDIKDNEGNPVTDYSVKLFNGGEEIDVENGKATVSLGGAYQIWAYANSSVRPNYECSGFTFVYVINGLTSIEFKEGTLTQEASFTDVMSTTWTFTATYASGATKILTADDVTIGTISTRNDGTYSVVVSYSESGITKTCTVEYRINGNYNPETVILDAANLSSGLTYSETTEIITDTIWITANTNTVTTGTCNYSMDDLTFTNMIKLGGAGKADYRSIKLNLTSAAEITVYGISSSSSTRTLALYNSSFSAIDNTFTNDGSGIGKGSFITSEAGIYYLASTSGGFNVCYIKIEYLG